ncbi:hypothetical protein HDV57DRAFT_486255 [Trichoderma longibrachiatum]
MLPACLPACRLPACRLPAGLLAWLGRVASLSCCPATEGELTQRQSFDTKAITCTCSSRRASLRCPLNSGGDGCCLCRSMAASGHVQRGSKASQERNWTSVCSVGLGRKTAGVCHLQPKQ